MQSAEKWQKVLWKAQEYEDNHVDKTFLDGMEKNRNIKEFEVFDTLIKKYAALVLGPGQLFRQEMWN